MQRPIYSYFLHIVIQKNSKQRQNSNFCQYFQQKYIDLSYNLIYTNFFGKKGWWTKTYCHCSHYFVKCICVPRVSYILLNTTTVQQFNRTYVRCWNRGYFGHTHIHPPYISPNMCISKKPWCKTLVMTENVGRHIRICI